MTRTLTAAALALLTALPALAQPRTSRVFSDGPAPAQNGGNKPKILLGVDAQAPMTFDKVVEVGANCLIRYDNGPQKNIPLETWMNEARRRNLFYIVQGTALFADGRKPKLPDPNLLAIAQDDEPDLNRWHDGQDNSMWIDSGRFKGWMKPEILQQRYKDWKAAAPDVPVIVNFAGQHVSNPWYVDGSGHKDYLAASDWHSFDWYVRNTHADRYLINFIGWTMDKLTKWGNNAPMFAYIECSDQILDGNAAGGIGRGPTPQETAAEIWHALAHGAKGVWLFPQQIRGGFQYWAVTPEVEKQIKETFATIKRNEALIADGTRTFKEEFPTDGQKQKWPTWEEVTWTSKDGKRTLTVHIDLSGEEAPKVTESK